MSKDARNIVSEQISKHKKNISVIEATIKEGNGTCQMLEDVSMEKYAINSLNEVLGKIGFQELITGE